MGRGQKGKPIMNTSKAIEALEFHRADKDAKHSAVMLAVLDALLAMLGDDRREPVTGYEVDAPATVTGMENSIPTTPLNIPPPVIEKEPPPNV